MKWPLPSDVRPTVPRGGRGFAADRPGSKVYHAGVDLHANRHDLVVSPDEGRVVSIFSWPSWKTPTGRAVMIQGDSGPVYLLAPIEPASLSVRVGDRVHWKQPIGGVGVYPRGSSMLHFEMYTQGTRANQRWYKGKARPPELLDPTLYLEAAAAEHARQPTPASANGGGGIALLLLVWLFGQQRREAHAA